MSKFLCIALYRFKEFLLNLAPILPLWVKIKFGAKVLSRVTRNSLKLFPNYYLDFQAKILSVPVKF